MLEMFVYKKGIVNNFIAKPSVCKCCNQLIIGRGFYFEEWSRIRTPKFQQRFVCVDCFTEGKHLLARPLKNIYEHVNTLTVIFTNSIPYNVFPYIPSSPEYGLARNIDSFSLADEELVLNPEKYRNLKSVNKLSSNFVDGRELLAKKDRELDSLEYAEKILKGDDKE